MVDQPRGNAAAQDAMRDGVPPWKAQPQCKAPGGGKAAEGDKEEKKGPVIRKAEIPLASHTVGPIISMGIMATLEFELKGEAESQAPGGIDVSCTKDGGCKGALFAAVAGEFSKTELMVDGDGLSVASKSMTLPLKMTVKSPMEVEFESEPKSVDLQWGYYTFKLQPGVKVNIKGDPSTLMGMRAALAAAAITAGAAAAAWSAVQTLGGFIGSAAEGALNSMPIIIIPPGSTGPPGRHPRGGMIS
ncbi:MAG TPA: hypothetical protein QGF58_16450 [Myxococcota bacterium]|nr:hypothetical protein [Myxococcota bacterium]